MAELKPKRRFVIEGEWIGYRPSQDHVVHRSVHPHNLTRLKQWAENVHAITFTDGTSLRITVRDCKFREKVQQIHGYDSLIEECFFHGVNSVEALAALRKR
jgi:hypothetical protein